MAGQTVIPVDEQRDDTFTICWRADPGASVAEVILPPIHRDAALVAACLHYSAANGATLTGAIAKSATGEALGTNTVMTDAVNLDGTADLVYHFVIDDENNWVLKTDRLVLDFMGGSTAANLGVVQVTLVFDPKRH